VSGSARIPEALEALRVDSLSQYVWLGQRFEVRREAPGDRAMLASALATRLYLDFYCPGGVAPPEGPPDPPGSLLPSPYVKALSAANNGRGSSQAGWTVVAADDGLLVVERDGLKLWARPSEVAAPDGRREPGSEVTVVVPSESLGLAPGFYTAYGDAGGCSPDAGTAVDRFYWNVQPAAGPAVLGAVTTVLNGAGIPFRFKIADDPAAVRCDAGVLYATPSWRPRVVPALERVLGLVAPHLWDRTGPFTLRLAPGLAFAEDPPGDDSFGSHRCRLLAEAVVEAHVRGMLRTEDRLAVVADRFAADGLSLDAPHLGAGSDPDAAPTPFGG
jgi:hypothetical protein